MYIINDPNLLISTNKKKGKKSLYHNFPFGFSYSSNETVGKQTCK